VGAVAEGAGAVAEDDSYLGVFAQPGGEGVRGAVCEDVDGRVGVHVDEDRCVGATAAHGELVDARTPGGGPVSASGRCTNRQMGWLRRRARRTERRWTRHWS
jgi:hypothetical protein